MPGINLPPYRNMSSLLILKKKVSVLGMFILTFFVHFYPNYPTEVLMLNLWYQMYSQKVYYQNTQPVWTLFLFKSIHPAVCEIVSKLAT